jgi:ABC-2 type transport system ATP-binding protein
MERPAVVVDDLVVDRGGRPVLKGLTLAIPAGQITGLLGPSGSGKTTLLRCLVGVQRVRGGSVAVLGRPAGTPGLRSEVGYVTQAPSVYSDLSVADNLRYFAAVGGATSADAERALVQVGLSDRAEDLVGKLSGGQRTRVSLACALVGSPSLLVLDEPTVGLDPVLRRDLWALFHRLADDDGTTVVVSSHVMDEAARCDRLLLLRDGRLVADDTPAQLRHRTGTDDLEEAFLRLAEKEEAIAVSTGAGGGR